MQISTGRSRRETNWQVIDLTLQELRDRLSSPHRTHETMAEYKAMKKDDRDRIKDIGGFVGGVVLGGRRKKGSVESRTLITLDADYAPQDAWDVATALVDYEVYCYSTHSHTPKLPRLRFIIPLARAVTADEYEPLARMVAKDIGIHMFDVTTYEAERLMYWPSAAKDGAFFYEEQLGELLDPDAVLKRYTNWRDTLEWPLADNETAVREKRLKQQGDPLSKPGVVGLFNRTYDIREAIDRFLPEIYTATDLPTRYTYAPGSTSAGVIVYEQFIYSHHATDPAGGRLSNAFDMVRLHLFGDRDSDPELPPGKQPSFRAMQELVLDDPGCKRQSLEDFDTPLTVTDDWTSQLELNPNGKGFAPTISNIEIVLRNDEGLIDRLALDTFSHMWVIKQPFPWTRELPGMLSYWSDHDESQMRKYLEKYGFTGIKQALLDALNNVAYDMAYHPVQDYLAGVSWDGAPRAERLFVDYLGAEDTPYTRMVTRKWLTAGIARIMNPGCKFDNMIVLVGAQGIGKSYLARKLSKGWFTDTEIKPGAENNKPMEALRGKWIVEWAELSSLKKAAVESTKSYISSQEDYYRPAYGRNIQVFPRQCVFYGSTNDVSFLRDPSGNRRFWPIAIPSSKKRSRVFDELTDEIVDQIWAEAVVWFYSGMPLHLQSGEEVRLAAEEQRKYETEDPWLNAVEEYLERLFPANWEDLTLADKRNYALGYSQLKGTVKRDEITVAELDWELMGKMPSERRSDENNFRHSQMARLQGWESTNERKIPAQGLGRTKLYRRIL